MILGNKKTFDLVADTELLLEFPKDTLSITLVNENKANILFNFSLLDPVSENNYKIAENMNGVRLFMKKTTNIVFKADRNCKISFLNIIS